MLRQRLEELEQSLASLGLPVVAGLRPPLDDSVLTEALEARGLMAPPEVVELFGWHDGYAPPPGMEWTGELGPGWQFPTFSQCLNAMDENQEMYGLLRARGENDSLGWLPIFGTASVATICIDTQPGLGFGRLTTYHSGFMPAAPGTSIENIVNEALGYIRDGSWVAEGDGLVDMRPVEARSATGIFGEQA